MRLPLLILFFIALLPSLSFGHGNCRFTFSTAIVVASGHTKNPLFDITKADTMHPLGHALRRELVVLEKDPREDHFPSLHAQLPQIINWLGESVHRVDQYEKSIAAQSPKNYSQEDYLARKTQRETEIPRLAKFLEAAYAKSYITYYDYIKTLYEASLLLDFWNPKGINLGSSLSMFVDTLLMATIYTSHNIVLVNFDTDPTHLDFIRSSGAFTFATLKVTNSEPDMGITRMPSEHLFHDAIAHGAFIAATLQEIGFDGQNRLTNLASVYINKIRPLLSEPQKPYGDSIMAHLLHAEPLFNPLENIPDNVALPTLSDFVHSGVGFPFERASKYMLQIRKQFANYRNELQGDQETVADDLLAMATHLRKRFIQHLNIPHHPTGETYEQM